KRKMVLATEYAVFGFLVATIYGVGFFVSFKRASALTLDEVLLGGRNLKTLPLAVSVLASVVSSTGFISFTAHFYAYGINMIWTLIAVFAMIPVTVRIIIPVLYPLKVTSVFE
ncbi:sodium-dependent multivitamin transporter, putative, partial [Ixodes scapularis]